MQISTLETTVTEGISRITNAEPRSRKNLPGTIVDMSGRGVPKYQLYSAALLAILCLLVGGACLLPGESSHLGDTAAPVSLYDTVEAHHWELVQHGVAATRFRHGLVGEPVWLPHALSVISLGGAALLIVLMARRGAVISRGPENFGRQRLLHLRINRR